MHLHGRSRGGPSGVAAVCGIGNRSGAAGSNRGARGASRRGVASVLAMLYMVLFSALALGFYTSVTIAAQAAHNERRGAMAQLAAESGLGFTRYQLSRVDLPLTLPEADQMNEIYLQLAKRLNGTPNLAGELVGYESGVISFPPKGHVSLDAGGQRFRTELRKSGDKLVAKVAGRGAGDRFARGIEVTFARVPKTTTLFNYGVASRGSINTSGAATITGVGDAARGSIISTSAAATAVTIDGKAVSGSISLTNPKGAVSLGSNVSVGGSTISSVIYRDHVHVGVPEPRFPDVDTSVYSKYATNVYAPGMTQLDNCRVPAGVACELSSGTIRGVLYLEKGASLRCSGGVTVQAVIVGSTESTGDLDKHVIEFSGSVTALPLKDLPESFGDVRNIAGAFIIAPTYRVKLWGHFGSIAGTIICGQFQMGGSAEGTIVGSVIQMLDVPMTISGSADVIIAGAGSAEYPPGVTFGAYYAAQHATYLEVAP